MNDLSGIESPSLITKDWEAMNTHERIQHLELEGYLVIPDLLSKGQLEMISEETSSLKTTRVDYSEHQRTHKDLQFSSCENIKALINHPVMTDFLSKLFGDQILCTSCQYTCSHPGHPGIYIHTDSQPFGSKIFGVEASCPRLVRVLYYLDDLTPECSPFKVIPRSHLSFHRDGNPYMRYKSHPDEQMITCKAGSAAIINQAVFHGNYPNLSNRDRRMLAIAYRPSWAGPIDKVDDWKQEDVDSLPDELKSYFMSRNTKNINFDVENRPKDAPTEGVGISPTRWKN